jgi:hypothetical protein
MSAGHSLRRGYAYGVSTAAHAPTSGRSASTDMVSLIVMATLVFVIVAVASDPVLAASVGRGFGTAWSDAIAFFLRVVSR